MPRKKKKDFETSIEELEKIIEALETGTISLEDSIQKYKEGIGLVANCTKLLEQAEQEVYLYENDVLTKISGAKQDE